jgi:hypothetical protein
LEYKAELQKGGQTEEEVIRSLSTFSERVMKVKNRMFCEEMIQRSKPNKSVSENKERRKRKRKRKQAPKLPEACNAHLLERNETQ